MLMLLTGFGWRMFLKESAAVFIKVFVWCFIKNACLYLISKESSFCKVLFESSFCKSCFIAKLKKFLFGFQFWCLLSTNLAINNRFYYSLYFTLYVAFYSIHSCSNFKESNYYLVVCCVGRQLHSTKNLVIAFEDLE